MKKMILFSLSLLSFAFAHAMEYHKIDTKQPEEEKSKEIPYVTLISSDGYEFKVPQEVVFQVPWLEAALESSMKEGHNQEIKLSYSAEVLELFLRIMAIFAQSENLTQTLINLKALFANYDSIKDVYMECIDNHGLPWRPFVPVITKDLHDRHKSNLQAIEQEIIDTFQNPAIRGLLAKLYYLNYGTFKQFLDVKADYGFSIAELNAAGLIPPIKLAEQSDSLDLSNLKINNLKGLLDIPGLEDLTELNISHNQLELETFLPILKDIKKAIGDILIIKLEHNPLTTAFLLFKAMSIFDKVRDIFPLSFTESDALFKQASLSNQQLTKILSPTQKQLMLEYKDILEEALNSSGNTLRLFVE